MNRPEPATADSRPRKPPALASTRQHRHRRRCLLIALAAFSSALALAACRGPGKPTTAPPSRTTTASSGSNSSALPPGLAYSKCMRAHGVPNFPDPTTTMPSNPPAQGAVENINGAVFLIPSSIEVWSPAFKQAATACGLPS